MGEYFWLLFCSTVDVLDGFDQLLSFIIHCPQTLSSALWLINLYVIKKFKFLSEKSWERRESNPGQLNEERECYPCAMPTPYFPDYFVWYSLKSRVKLAPPYGYE